MTSFCGWQSVVEILRICCDETCSYLFYGSHNLPVLNFFRARKKVKKATPHALGKPRQSPSACEACRFSQCIRPLSQVFWNPSSASPGFLVLQPTLMTSRVPRLDFTFGLLRKGCHQRHQHNIPSASVRRGCWKGYPTYIHLHLQPTDFRLLSSFDFTLLRTRKPSYMCRVNLPCFRKWTFTTERLDI